MIEMDDRRIVVVGPESAALAAGLPVRAEHEVIDDELAAAAEQFAEGDAALFALEHIIGLDFLPRERTPLGGERLAGAGEGLFLLEQPQPRRSPVGL